MVDPAKSRKAAQKQKSARLAAKQCGGGGAPLRQDFVAVGVGPSLVAFQSPPPLHGENPCLAQMLAAEPAGASTVTNGFPRGMSEASAFAQPSFVAAPCAVPPLQHLVLRSIVSKMECMRSLKGVPQHIGNILLNALSQLGVWDTQSRFSEAALNLFIDAYESRVLGGLVVSGFPVSQYMDKFSSFVARSLRFVTSLDLSNCGLEAHDILLSLGTFPNLQMLNLAGNNLTAQGIHMLLVRQKVYRDCFQNLKFLDLHKSHLIGSNLSTVLGLPKLERLCFSVCLDGIDKRDFDFKPHGARVTFLVPTISTKKTIDQYLSEAGFQRDTDPYQFASEDLGFLSAKLKRWMVNFTQSCEPPVKFEHDKAYLCLSGMCVETFTNPYEKRYDHYYVFRNA